CAPNETPRLGRPRPTSTAMFKDQPGARARLGADAAGLRRAGASPADAGMRNGWAARRPGAIDFSGVRSMAPIIEPPKHWQDWASWALGIWLILSPWTLMYWTQSVPLENALTTGALLLL